MFVEVLLPSVDHFSLIRQEAFFNIYTHIGLWYKALTGSVELLVKLASFLKTVQLLHLISFRFFQAAFFVLKDAGLLFPFLFVSFHVLSSPLLQHLLPCCVLS